MHIERLIPSCKLCPLRMFSSVNAEHMFQGQDVGVAEILGGLRERLGSPRIGRDLGLRKGDTDTHCGLLRR